MSTFNHTVSEKKAIMTQGQQLLTETCDDKYSCNTLEDKIQNTRFKCNDLFRVDTHAITDDSLCSDLLKKQKEINEQINELKLGGKKRKTKGKSRKNKKRKTKGKSRKNKKRKTKGKSRKNKKNKTKGSR